MRSLDDNLDRSERKKGGGVGATTTGSPATGAPGTSQPNDDDKNRLVVAIDLSLIDS
jgi:hypothetical protein